uniref:Uncharacterized protein n=1 Tax=Siphoviridae sp. ctnFV5 TaxID=2823600 RepID=A0A8S5L712_9CAUD|nr:MAG TPA: hypothetical protein [Siphoviridae sp. ctnFV5]
MILRPTTAVAMPIHAIHNIKRIPLSIKSSNLSLSFK